MIRIYKKIERMGIWVLFVVLYSCQNQIDTNTKNEEKTDSIPVVEVNDKQMKTMGIELASLQEHAMNDFVLANGVLDAPSSNKAIVTAKMEGFVKQSAWLVGDYVSQGQVLTVLETPRLIGLQEEYLTVKNQIVFLEQEFVRQTRLSTEEVGAKKDLQKTSVELQNAKIRLASLERQLQFVGVNANGLTTSNLSPQFAVVSPISGYIKTIQISKGQSVSPETVLFEVVNKDNLYLKLQVFEKDIQKLQKGQKVYFQISSMGEETFEGEVFVISQNFDLENKTTSVHVAFKAPTKDFMPNMYANARIAIGETQVLAIAEEAVIQDGDESILFFTTDKKHFYPTTIKVKNRESGLISFEWTKPIPKSAWIVKKGANFLQAATEPKEEE